MNTHKDWKNYQFVDDGGMEIDDVELSDDESDQNQNQNLIQQKKKGKGGRPKASRQVCNVKGCFAHLSGSSSFDGLNFVYSSSDQIRWDS